MSNKDIDNKMDKQRQGMEKEKQYNNIAGLGWKSFGIALVVIILVGVIYAIF